MSKKDIRPWLIQGSKLFSGPVPPVEFHAHSTWTDGRSTVVELVESAHRIGLGALALTEHANFDTDWYADFVAEVTNLRSANPDMSVYYGVEVAAADYEGALKADSLIVDQAEMVVGVVHSYPKGPGTFWSFADVSADDALELEINALLGLANSPMVDVIGHPGGTYFAKYGPFPVRKLEPVMKRAKANGKAVEMNSRHCWDAAGMLELLRRVDPLVSIGSDAHCSDEVGRTRDLIASFGEATAEAD